MSVNDSEARLAEMSRRTFLSMWSYQNPYYDEGKELCDVLVVFGNDVIIVSDKVISFNSEKDEKTSWNRWYRKAVLKSVAQLRGALKTIKNRPECIHLDAQISSPFPLNFPDPDRTHFHLLAVAQGIEEECFRKFGKASLAIDSSRTGHGTPLEVGVKFPEFVHVINRTVLEALFECFDTAKDFVQYLTAKEAVLTQKHVRLAGEEDLVGAYMKSRRPDGTVPLDALCCDLEDGVYGVPHGTWDVLRSDENFMRRKSLLASSYVIDRFIEQQASEYLSGRGLVGQDMPMDYHATAFQTLAAESRIARLLIGVAIVDVLNENPATFWCTAVESIDQPGLLYLWLIYPIVSDEITDEEIEATVMYQLDKYVFVAMGKFPESHKIFGVALPNEKSKRTSRLVRIYERNIWTSTMQKDSELLGQKEGILSHIESTTRIVIRAI